MKQQTRSAKPSRSIPEHIKRAVNARDNFRCQNCGVNTEFIHYDHKYPFDLGGPTTVENIQSLCPKCNTSKGNKIQCHHCRHWMSPDNAKCPQCGSKFPFSKRNQTLAGKLEILFEKVGRAVVIGGMSLVLVLFASCGAYLYFHFAGGSRSADQAAHVETVVNQSIDVTADQPASFEVVVPARATNARIVGGYKVTSGSAVNCYVVDGAQRQLAAKENSSSSRLRQTLAPGTYYLQFVAASGAALKVAAEFYLKFD
jgi:Zn finger protein HypA/HybF involved in hydrogenase expression